MFKRRHFKNFAIISIVSIFLFSSCDLKVPIKEMTDAKKGISKALRVKADKYAPEELEAARNRLFESHKNVVAKKSNEAKKLAEESVEMSIKAYSKAVLLLAKDAISIAEKSLEEAGEVYAERLAGGEYRGAQNDFVKANELFQNKKYYESYLKALDADRKARDAKNISISKKDILRDSIVEVKRILEEAEKYGAKKYSSEKYKLANENLGIAEKSYDSMELKKGFSAIEVAKINADDIYLIAIEKRATEKVAVAEKTILRAEKSRLASGSQDEIQAAKESYEDAKHALSESSYKESINASDEAIRLASIALGIEPPDGTDLLDKKRDEISGKEGHKEESIEKDYFLYTVVYRKNYKDCLWYIAKRYYKNPRLWKKIYNFNREKIYNPHLIFPGWVLKVPKLKK